MATQQRQYKSKTLLVAAIDLGTTFNGYAFSFQHDYEADPSKIFTNQTWVAGSTGLLSLKAPTAVLFDENKKFHSFGYEAEDNYSMLALDENNHKWYFFKRFKMILYNEKITRNTEIEDVQGRKMKAMDVFGAVINYLKNHLLVYLNSKFAEIYNDDIHWVLTVPAICSDSAKQFMMEAAYKADIDGAQMSIALEPEAASLFCHLSLIDKIHGSEGAKCVVTSPDTKYMVIDLGADTTNITVLEGQADEPLRELHKASIGDCGGTTVEEEFYSLLIKIIGGPVYQRLGVEDKGCLLELQRGFEITKRLINPESERKVTIRMPEAIGKTYKDEMKKSIKDAIDGSPYLDKITYHGNKIRLDAMVCKGFFKACTDKIVFHITDMLKQPALQGTQTFFLVGGFAESVMVQDAIKKAIPKGMVIIPNTPELAVLKGAVLFGHRHTR